MNKIFDLLKSFTPIITGLGLLISLILYFLHLNTYVHALLLLLLLVGCIPFVKDMLVSFYHKEFGVDLIAITGIIASIFLGEFIAGAVILLMLSGGELLEKRALKQARKELTDLLSNAPTIAHKKTNDILNDITVDTIQKNDILIVKPNEIIPVDGLIMSGTSQVDESKLTGESVPVEKSSNMQVMSGSLNKNGILEIQALRTSKNSKYEQIIRLVKEADANKAPFVRLADRYSVIFTIISFSIAGFAWIHSGNPVFALAVLVVATPCPLILATPTAFAAGISKAAKKGIIIKNGAAIERLSMAHAFLFDKTGTVTLGTPTVQKIISFESLSEEEILSYAASLDQYSVHILGQSITTYAKGKNVLLFHPKKFEETLGNGVEGIIKNHFYLFGKLSFLKSREVHISDELQKQHDMLKNEGTIITYLAQNTTVIGAIYFADSVRPNVREFFKLISQKVKKIEMVTGDKKEIALHIAKIAGIYDVIAECLPEDKLKEVRKLQNNYRPVIMVGDGVNDAPALAAADVGIAIGGKNSTAATEAGDIVIMVDNIELVIDAFTISQRIMYIARQCIYLGIGLSVILMIFAAFGFIKPVYGALMQEGIDIIVILNALRARTGK